MALALRLALLVAVSAAPSWDGVIYVRAAEQLAAGEGYTLRILDEHNRATPTAFYPVGFPAVLAGVRLLGGGLLADRWLQVLATTALVPLSYLFARRARHRRAGRAAAWAMALWPGGIFLSATWLAEPMFALGVAVSLLPLAYARRRMRMQALVLAGLGLGLTAYVRASSLPMAALLGALLGYAWYARFGVAKRWFGALGLSALVVAACLVPLAPWAYRNSQLLGAPALVSTNGGVNLLIGTRGDGGFAPIAADEECKQRPLREVERDRCYRRHALAIIAGAPLQWMARGLLKLAHTFGHESAPAQCFADGLFAGSGSARETWRLWALGATRFGWLLLMVLAASGGGFVARHTSAIPRAVLLAPIFALAALHTLYLGGDRYHPAVAPMVMALAGIGYAERQNKRRAATRASDTRAPERLESVA